MSNSYNPYNRFFIEFSSAREQRALRIAQGALNDANITGYLDINTMIDFI